jgi:tetratricopeptide (TPR) repeat protein
MISDCKIHTNNKNLTEAQKFLDLAYEFLRSNRSSLKISEGDRSLLFSFKLIDAKLGIFCNSSTFPAMQLLEIDREFEEVTKKLRADFRTLPEVGKAYASLSNAYANYFSYSFKSGLDAIPNALQMAEKYLAAAESTAVEEGILKQVSNDLAITYSEYGVHTKEIKYFDRALELHSKYNTYSGATKINKGIEVSNAAEEDYFFRNKH